MFKNPAALKAFAEGDLKNAEIANTPGGIEAQEKAGQKALVASTNMPKEMLPSKEDFEKLGFVFGDDVDDLFISAKFPDGWTRGATNHAMYSDIVDEKGRRRVVIFYKAAFYDRRAEAHLVARFKVGIKYPDGDGRISKDTMVPVVVFDDGTEIYRVGERKYFGDQETGDRLEKEGLAWLDKNRPGWNDVVKGWMLDDS